MHKITDKAVLVEVAAFQEEVDTQSLVEEADTRSPDLNLEMSTTWVMVAVDSTRLSTDSTRLSTSQSTRREGHMVGDSPKEAATLMATRAPIVNRVDLVCGEDLLARGYPWFSFVRVFQKLYAVTQPANKIAE